MHRRYSNRLDDCDHVDICWSYTVAASTAKSFAKTPIRLGPLLVQHYSALCTAGCIWWLQNEHTAPHECTAGQELMSKCMKLKCATEMHVVAFPQMILYSLCWEVFFFCPRIKAPAWQMNMKKATPHTRSVIKWQFLFIVMLIKYNVTLT